MNLAAAGQYLISGLTTGGVYALIAVGFTLIYNTCDIVNFAQGEFAMIGGMLAVTILNGLHLPLWCAILLAIVGSAAIGGVLALAAIYPLRRISSLGLIILTIGLSIVLRGLAMIVWGKDARMLPAFSARPPIVFAIGGDTVVLLWQAVWALGTAFCLVLGLFLFFKYTNSGRAMRACASNHRAARICGISPRRITVAAFILSAAFGAIGGIVVAPMTMTGYDVGVMLGLKGFCAAVVGGLTSMPGAIIGGLALGVLEALSAGFISSHLKEILAFLALIGILYLRPAGLLGRRS